MVCIFEKVVMTNATTWDVAHNDRVLSHDKANRQYDHATPENPDLDGSELAATHLT
jgi:hypothetical protein